MNLSSILGNSKRLIYILTGFVLLLIFLIFLLALRNFGGPTASEKATLEFWGVFDERGSFAKAIEAFQQVHPEIKINYRSFPYADYETAVVNAFAAGKGPDIWMIHNTWLPKHMDKLRPMPNSIPGLKQPLFTIKTYQDQFVDVAYRDLVIDGKIYGVPLYIDTLALYYNKDLFNNAGLTRPPVSWDEFNEDVKLLTKTNPNNNDIIQAGAAIGSAKNINRSTDILMAFMLQSGVRMTDPSNQTATFANSVDNQKVGENALQYYTDFTNPSKQTYCWNDNLHYSIDSFVEGSTAMMFNYSHQVSILRDKSSRANFGVSTMPQLSKDVVRNYASYWAPAVAAASRYPNQAWQFLAYLSSNEGAISYLNVTDRPAARRDLIEIQKSDPELGVFALQSLTAKSWYQVDNEAIETIFANMIDDVNLGRASVKNALESAQAQVNTLMRKARDGTL
jgi:multiple sugar transport system substrate-binding protein